MSWIARGQDHTGFVQDAPGGQTATVPAIATHRGELWCLWSDVNGDMYYAIGDNNAFQPRKEFPDKGIPVVAELTGVLHAVVVRNGDMVHYVFDDMEEIWTPPSVLNRDVGFVSHTTPALVAFHNKLFLAYVRDSSLCYSIWTQNPQDETKEWSYPQEVSGIHKVCGIPAQFVLNSVLHVVCESQENAGDFLGFAYSSSDNVWNSCDDVSEGKAASGISATSYGDSAFMAFQENGPTDTSHVIFISEYKDGQWHAQEAVAGQASWSPPQLAVLNGRINCIFNTNTEEKDLKWYSRSLLDYSLNSWMSNVPDERLLSSITIPGTHDTCARSNVPFVRTQYLSITKQMEAGLRILDLRCRLHDDGQLYMYHGGIPINIPHYLKLDTVMNDIFTFFEKNTETPTETVLISINNDDTSGALPHAVFYNGVKSHIEATPHYPDGSPRWITKTTTATLGEARGKAVLLRRFQPDPDVSDNDLIGIDLSGWLNNNPEFTLNTASGLTITLQDHWSYTTAIPLADLIASKFSYVTSLLSKAASGSPEQWFINFSSAVGVPSTKGEIAESHWIAVGAHSGFIGKFVTGMNQSLRRKFRWDGKTRYGALLMDYPELPKDSDMIACLIGTNM